MAKMDAGARARAGWRWGPFTFRVPFWHTRLCWPEFLQGTALASATGLALVPMMTAHFGLSFEEAVTMSLISGFLLGTAPILFGEPYAPGWVTPALPLVLTFVLGGYDSPVERFQAMTALAITLSAMLVFLGASGIGKRFMEWLPDALKAGLILGAAIAAFKRVFVDDAPDYLLAQPIATIAACAVCLIFIFSIPFRLLKTRFRFLRVLGGLGLLPGFLVAAIVGPLVGEVQYEIEWGILIPPFADTWAKVSPLAIGWPEWEMFVAAMPLALVTYIILFGDLVTGNEIIRDASAHRPDEVIDIDTTRTHWSLAIRNAVMAVAAPFFPTQGSVWTGVHVAIVQRWRQGPKAMGSLHSGIASYYFMGLPFVFFLLPLLTGLKPLMGIALSLTLVLTGFACAYVAMAVVRHPAERGVALLTGAALAFFEPWQGLLLGLVATFTLIGGRSADAAEARVSAIEQQMWRDESQD